MQMIGGVSLLSICVLSSIASADKHTPPILELQVPTYVLPQDNFNISCKANRPISIKVNNCIHIVTSKSFQREEDKFQWIYHVAHIKKPCEVQCFLGQQKVTREVQVIDGVITSKYYNVTVSKGMAFTLTCSSRCRSGFCQVAWTANKRSMFVKNDNDHTVWSTPPYKGIQTHHLNVESAGISTDYQCLLIAITGRIIDSAEQQVYVKDSENGSARTLIGYLKPEMDQVQT